MVSQSTSSVSIVLCLTAMLMAASTTEAQVSSVPKRHRNNNSKEFGNKQRQQNRQQQQKRNDNISRKLEDDISMPLQESGFDVKMMSIPLRSMSIPLHDLRLDLSMPLQELEFDLSMPSQTLEGANTLDDGSDSDGKTRKLEDDISMPLQESGFDVKMMSIPLRSMSIPLHDLRLDLSMPLQELEFDLSMPSQTLEGANTLDDGSDSDGKTVILASFFAGISAFMIGAVALFMKMRQRKAEENGEADDMQVRVVSFAPPSDLNDVEEAASEVVIT